MKKILFSTLVAVTLLFSAKPIQAGSINKAEMFAEHGLQNEAKKELIDVIFQKGSNKDKAQAYYLLGNLAFTENNISVALKAWRDLIKKYPTSEQGVLVKDRISELAEIIGESTDETISNAVAQSYLRHADFWSKGKDRKFTIDSSWLESFDAAIKWYDKVIAEFPNTNASKLAYGGKLKTLLGWKESGKYGSSYGIKLNFTKYMPTLLDTFEAFVAEHPTASNIQAFRYQIAQGYWSEKNWVQTRKWLNTIITEAGDADSFYSDTATRRLAKIEY